MLYVSLICFKNPSEPTDMDGLSQGKLELNKDNYQNSNNTYYMESEVQANIFFYVLLKLQITNLFRIRENTLKLNSFKCFKA